ncbi:hemerythrin domain-containing protein [Streptodolium elevatio]|uniref:Hemerythrin domain-containing protein n=1 Tax=Streptodolium elevatio TaxID=3157996 RepID=A0ABV3DJQ8_9ACTN
MRDSDGDHGGGHDSERGGEVGGDSGGENADQSGGHGGGIVAELTADHRMVEDLVAVWEHATDGADGADPEAQQAAERLVAAVAAHVAAEEEYLLPAVREHLADGHQFADATAAGNRRTEELLKDLEDGRDPAARKAAASELAAGLRAHVREQERVVFPALAAACPAGLLDDLGAKVRAAQKIGPTRPHPGAPRNAVARKLLDPVTGLVDRLRDVARGRGRA